MAESGQAEQRASEILIALLREVVKLPKILFVIGKGPEAVMGAGLTLTRPTSPFKMIGFR